MFSLEGAVSAEARASKRAESFSVNREPQVYTKLPTLHRELGCNLGWARCCAILSVLEMESADSGDGTTGDWVSGIKVKHPLEFSTGGFPL